MKKITLFLFYSLLFSMPTWAQKSIIVHNPMDENRVEIITIPYATFTKYFNVDSTFIIKDKNSTKTYEHQLEKLGTNKIQNVLIQVTIDAKARLSLAVEKIKAPVINPKTYARYIPERFDDFAWENDVVAFRLYGKALEGRSDDAQGMDYWSKRTPELIINKWYKEDDYHKDHGQGLDYYTVGQTLGAGDMALYFHNKVYFTKHYRDYQILDNGPLRTTFKLIFEEEQIDANTISLTKTISIDAGQQFNKICINLDNKTHNTTPIVLGLARRTETTPAVYFDPNYKSLAYWEPAVKDYGETGTALLVPDTKIDFIQDDKKQFLLKTILDDGKQLVYYNGAAWSKAGKITNAKQWDKYVKNYAERLQKPLKITLK